MKPGDLISVEDAASLLALHKNTVRIMIRDGKIPHVRIGGAVRVDKPRLEALLEAQARECELVGSR